MSLTPVENVLRFASEELFHQGAARCSVMFLSSAPRELGFVMSYVASHFCQDLIIRIGWI